MTPMDQQSTALLYGFWASTSGAESESKQNLDFPFVFLCLSDAKGTPSCSSLVVFI